MKIGFIGAGNMGSTIANGLLKDHKIDNDKVFIYDIDQNKLEQFSKYCNVHNEFEGVLTCEIVILAIEPSHYEEWLSQYGSQVKGCLVSVAAGISSTFLKKYVDNFIIAMPNTSAFINHGYTSIVENNGVDAEIFKYVVDIFERVGDIKIIQEQQLEAMIAMAGSAPAYNYVFINAMAQFGVAKGLSYKESCEIAAHVMSGSSSMVFLTHEDPKVLLSNVCSPNGATEKAVEVFNNSEIDQIIYDAMNACFERAETMKKENDKN